ncbi:MAG TPA: phosphatase PAP2 family protein [Micromonosporaceae bacterium]|nr:phosphatase PAP2 family protein [Micromonosporaceae bacterium]
MAWLAALAVANLVLLLLVVKYSIGTIRGQMLDTVALAGNSLGRVRFGGTLNTALDAISVASLVLVLLVVGLIALLRRRFALAVMAVILVAGSVATTYVLKYYVITRTDLGVDPERAAAGNSLPSGHATAAAAFAVGLVLVLPKGARGIASLLGATYAAIVGVATLSAGWHRPSDVLASYLIVGGWAAAAGLLLVALQRPGAVVSERDRAGLSLAGTLVGGVTLLGAGVVALALTFNRMSVPVDEMSSRLLTLGYMGSVATITGAAYLMMAVVLVTVHRVVPQIPASTSGDQAPLVTASAGAG